MDGYHRRPLPSSFDLPPTGLRRWRAAKMSGTLGEFYHTMAEDIDSAMRKEAFLSCAIRWCLLLDDKAAYPVFGPNGEGSLEAEDEVLIQTERRLMGPKGAALLIMADGHCLSNGRSHNEVCQFCATPGWSAKTWEETFRGCGEYAYHHWQDVITIRLDERLVYSLVSYMDRLCRPSGSYYNLMQKLTCLVGGQEVRSPLTLQTMIAM